MFDFTGLNDKIKVQIMWTIRNICETGTPFKVGQFILNFKLLDLVVGELQTTNSNYLSILIKTIHQLIRIELILSP
jgi:hypothetical protein